MNPLETTAGATSADELLGALDEGRRVVVRTEFLGEEHEGDVAPRRRRLLLRHPDQTPQTREPRGDADLYRETGYASE